MNVQNSSTFSHMKFLCTLSLIGFVWFPLLSQEIIILGIAQDGGFPHIGCQNECLKAHRKPSHSKYVSSISVADPESKKWWLFDASPDMDKQLQYFRDLTDGTYPYLPAGIFLTHAHIGHYTGLMSLGREALGARNEKVYALPKMINYLKENGPWSQLVTLKNIELNTLAADLPVQISENVSVEAFTVPHRDEFSETAGYKISFGGKNYYFIPDIDKWEKWENSIIDLLEDPTTKMAFLDASFYADGELPNRPMSEVPHPFVTETMQLLSNKSLDVKGKIKFIHLNHTNPLLFDRKIQKEVKKKGFGLAEQGKKYN